MAVTLEGVYRLIDRASPTLRSIERRAQAADRALNRLGRTMDRMTARQTVANLDKLGGSMSKLEGNTNRVERVMARTGATAKSTNRELEGTSRTTRKITSDMGGLERAMRKVLIIGGGLGKVLAPARFALIAVAIRPLIGVVQALGAGAIALVQQVGQATGALVPMIARLGDVAGAGAAAATVLISVKAAALVTKFAMNGVSQAINGNVAAFKKLTPQAKAFVNEMRKLRPIMNTIRQSAQGGLFGGLRQGIQTARRNGAFQFANTAAGGMGRAVGGVASRAATQLTNPAVLNDLTRLSGTADFVITRLGGSVINLAQAFIGVLTAAQPLTRWLVTTIQHWSKYLVQQVQIGRETGRLQAYFQRTRTTLTELGHAARDFGMGFLNIMHVARGQSGQFGAGLDHIAKTFRDWTANFNNQARIALWFQRAQASAKRLASILGDVLRIFGGLGRAAQGLGRSMTGGMDRTLSRWATWINSFKGQSVLTQWFASARGTLSALWRLLSDISGAFFRLGQGGGGATGLINAIDKLVPDLERVLRSISTNIGPGLIGTVQQLLHLLSTIVSGSGSPLGMMLNLTNNILTGINSILDRFHAVRTAVVIAFTVISGSILLNKLLAIAGGVENIKRKWLGVKVATDASTLAVEKNAAVVAAESRMIPGGVSTRTGNAVGFGGASNAVKAENAAKGLGTAEKIALAGGGAAVLGRFGRVGALASRAKGLLKIGRFGGGLASIAAPIAVGMGTQYAQGRGWMGGRTASNVNNVVQMAATGALVGSVVPGVGTVAGALAGGGAGLAMNAFSGGGGGLTPEQRYMASLNSTLTTRGFQPGQPQGGARNLTEANNYQRLLDQSRNRLLADRARAAPYSALSRARAAQLQAQGFGGRISQAANLDKQIALNRVLRGESIKRLGVERSIEKAQKAQADALRTASRIRTSQNIAAGLTTSFGQAYNVYRGHGMTAEQATTRVANDALKRSHSLRAAGRQTLLSGIHEWLVEQAKLHPALNRELAKFDTGMKKAMGQVGRTVVTSGKSVLQATVPQWIAIKNSMTTPLEKALQEMNPKFTALQNRAKAVLIGLGYSAPKADAIIRSMEGGAPGPTASSFGKPATTVARGFQFSSIKGFAGGGRIPGHGRSDTVAVAPGAMAAPGELIVNRHTESKADKVLRMAGTSLAGLVAGETKRHSDILPDTSMFALGGRLSAAISEANRISGLRSKYQFGGGHSTPAPGTPPWDCSSSTSRVLQAAGYNIPTMVASQYMKWGKPGPGPIGIAANPGHVYMMLNGRAWGTSYGNPGGGPGWIRGGGWRPGFVQRHAPNAGGGGARGGNTMGQGMGGTLPLQGLLPYADLFGGGSGFPLAASLRTGHIVAAGLQGKINTAIRKRNARAGGTRTAGGGGMVSGGGTPSQNEILARSMMMAAGWPAAQWPSLKNLWTRESSFRTDATGSATPLGHAYGIPQSLPGNKMATAGADWKTNPRTQIKWGLGYIRQRYGSPSAAWAHSEAMNPHWYARGGRTPDWGGWHAGGLDRTFDRPTMIGVGEKGQERVTVTPSRAGGGHGNITVGDIHVTIAGGTNASAADIRREMDHWAEDFARLLERQSTGEGA